MHHSVSSTLCYLKCPAKYRMKIIERTAVDRERSIPAAVGTAGHAGLEAAFSQHRHCASGSCETMTSHGPMARAALEASWQEQGLSENGGDLLHFAERLQAALDTMTAPDPADVLGVELQVEEPTPDGTAFKGFIDLLLRSGSNILVRDWKFTSRTLTREQLTADYQLNLYAVMIRQRHPGDTIWLSHYYPNKRTEIRVPSSPDHEAEALDTFEATVEMIEADTDFAPRPSEHCSHCDYQKICPAWTDPVGVEAQTAMRGF